MIRSFVVAGVFLGFTAGAVAQVAMAPAHKTTVAPRSELAVATAVVVRVNGIPKTVSDLDEMKQRVFPYFQIHGGQVPAGAEGDIRAKAMDELVLEELLFQEAKRRGIQVNETEFRKRMAEVRREFPSRAEYEKAVIARFGSVSKLEQRLRRALLTQKLWKLEVTNKALVREQSVVAYYNTNNLRFLRPDAVSLQTITIALPKNASAPEKLKARQRIEQILLRAQATKDYEGFGVLAEEVSEDNWRVMMGDHKWVHRGTFDKVYEDKIFAMRVGETSGIVESPQGFHIFRVNGKQASRQLTLPECRARIRTQLEKEKLAKVAGQFHELLLKKAMIETVS